MDPSMSGRDATYIRVSDWTESTRRQQSTEKGGTSRKGENDKAASGRERPREIRHAARSRTSRTTTKKERLSPFLPIAFFYIFFLQNAKHI